MKFRSLCSSVAAAAILIWGTTPLLASTEAADAPLAKASEARTAGARWLVEHQRADGGWGAGSFGRRYDASAQASSDVATTSLAVMALIRDAGNSSAHGSAIERGISFVVAAIEASPLEGPQLNGPQGTQPQHKLGRYVDTHLAALLLGNVAESPPKVLEGRIAKAYDKVLTKVMAAQQSDGSFERDGWAPVLSSSMAAQSLYKAHINGKAVDDEVLAKSDAYQRKLVDTENGRFETSKGAGVDLYAAATGLRGNKLAAKRGSTDAPEAAEFSAEAVRRDRGALVAGFGSVGGEEMLSYMMISESLAEDGGEDWESWTQKINAQLSATQNQDGSWSGHHCITSTPFVTAAAVMTLGASPAANVPAAAIR
jgi:hypothetical protein